jgi:hypothetical protein
MSGVNIEKDNLGWQIHQTAQKITEWWELQTRRSTKNIPEVDLFSWLFHPLTALIAQIVFWLILATLLIWLILLALDILKPYISQIKNNNFTQIQAKNQAKTISVDEWWLRAKKLEKKGHYRQACQCLYMAMLQELHQIGIAPQQASRTDGEYLKLVENLPNPRPYQTLLIRHQQLYFSQLESSLTILTECQQAYQQIFGHQPHNKQQKK